MFTRRSLPVKIAFRTALLAQCRHFSSQGTRPITTRNTQLGGTSSTQVLTGYPVAQSRSVASTAAEAAPTPSTGFLVQDQVRELFTDAKVPLVEQRLATRSVEAVTDAIEAVEGFPVVIKATGLLHKSDVGGVFVNVSSRKGVERVLANLDKIAEKHSIGDQVLIQPMIKNALPVELYVGAMFQPNYGHLITLGVGGFTVELHRDTATYLYGAPDEVRQRKVHSLNVAHGIFNGYRGCPALPESDFLQLLDSVERLVDANPHMLELDLNPVLYCAHRKKLIVVDARVRVLAAASTD